jgi:hypothetical protein
MQPRSCRVSRGEGGRLRPCCEVDRAYPWAERVGEAVTAINDVEHVRCYRNGPDERPCREIDLGNPCVVTNHRVQSVRTDADAVRTQLQIHMKFGIRVRIVQMQLRRRIGHRDDAVQRGREFRILDVVRERVNGIRQRDRERRDMVIARLRTRWNQCQRDENRGAKGGAHDRAMGSVF